MPFKNKGFTLIELLLTLAILTILLAIAIPNYSDFLAKKRLEGAAHEFIGTLTLAKSEALKLNTHIYLISTRTSASNWNVIVSNSATCTINTSCDLRNFSSSNATSISANTDITSINGVTIDPVRLLPSFTSAKSITFSNASYSLQIKWDVTGLTNLCIPSGQPQFGGYVAC